MAKHFLHISDYNTDQIWEILHLSKELKTKFHNKENFKPFRDRSLAMIFGGLWRGSCSKSSEHTRTTDRVPKTKTLMI